MTTKLTPEQALTISLYTGTMCVPFDVFVAEAEKIVGHKLLPLQHADPAIRILLKLRSQCAFMAMMPQPEEN